jgi:hypothetical protein
MVRRCHYVCCQLACHILVFVCSWRHYTARVYCDSKCGAVKEFVVLHILQNEKERYTAYVHDYFIWCYRDQTLSYTAEINAKAPGSRASGLPDRTQTLCE